jgi:hypothetical protein
VILLVWIEKIERAAERVARPVGWMLLGALIGQLYVTSFGR